MLLLYLHISFYFVFQLTNSDLRFIQPAWNFFKCIFYFRNCILHFFLVLFHCFYFFFSYCCSSHSAPCSCLWVPWASSSPFFWFLYLIVCLPPFHLALLLGSLFPFNGGFFLCLPSLGESFWFFFPLQFWNLNFASCKAILQTPSQEENSALEEECPQVWDSRASL